MLSNFLCGEKVRLTALKEQDVPAITSWQEDIGYMRLQDTKLAKPRSESQLAAELTSIQGTNNTILFGIRLVDEDILIGTLGFFDIEVNNKVAWFGIGLGDRSYWGKGYGTESMQIALRYGFYELNLHGLYLTVISYNDRAIVMYERLGFQRDGIFREFGEREGKRYDMILYSILRTEWERARK